MFALERRIYQIDTLRLNPAGVPLRGVAYTAALVVAALFVRAVPGLAIVTASIPWYVADLALPIALAALLAILRIEGRPFHIAAEALASHYLCPRRLVGLRPRRRVATTWWPPAIVCIADGSEATPRAARYRGPGAVLVGYAHHRIEWSRGLGLRRRGDLSLHPIAGALPASPVAIELAPGAVLEIARGPYRGPSAERD